MGRPRSLDESFIPSVLSDEELMLEHLRLQQWHALQRASGVDRVRVESMQVAVQAQLAKRAAIGLARSAAPMLAAVGGLNTAAAMASVGFTSGFLQGASIYAADHPESIPVVTRLQDELGQPLNGGAFGLGNQLGVGKGVILGFVDNVVGLLEVVRLLVRHGTPLGLAYGYAKQGIAFAHDPSAWMTKQAEEARAMRELVSGLYHFASEVQADPTVLIDLSEPLGMEAGVALAEWLEQDFMVLKPFDKGLRVGELQGRILIEIVLLFVGPEVILAKGAAAAGRAAMQWQRTERIIQRLLPVLKRVPVLRRLLEIRRLAQAAESGANAERAVVENFDRDVQADAWSKAKTKTASDAPMLRPVVEGAPDTERVATNAAPPFGEFRVPSNTPGPEVLESRLGETFVEPARPRLELPGKAQASGERIGNLAPDAALLAPKKPTPSGNLPRKPTDAELGVKVADAKLKIREKQPVVAARKAKAAAAVAARKANPGAAFESTGPVFSKGMLNAMEDLSTSGQALASRASGDFVLEQVRMLGVESRKGAFTPTRELLKTADASILRKERISDVAAAQLENAKDLGLEAKSVQLGDYKDSNKLKWLWDATETKVSSEAGSWMDMVLEQQKREIAIIDAARQQGGVVMFSGKVAGTNEKVVFFASPNNIKVSLPMPYGALLNN